MNNTLLFQGHSEYAPFSVIANDLPRRWFSEMAVAETSLFYVRPL